MNGDERRAGARHIVQGAGDDFFAGAGFAFDQNRKRRRRDLADLRAQFLHRRRFADQAQFGGGGAGDFARAQQSGAQRGRRARLGDKIDRAKARARMAFWI